MFMDSFSESRRNWTDLPIELLGFISDRLVLLPDFIRFGAACKPWSLAAKQAYNSRISLHQELPMLLVVPADDDGKCFLYSIWEKKIYPHNIQIFPNGTRYSGSGLGYGWLAFVEHNLPSQSTNNIPSVTLLNLFSGTTIPLPTIPYERDLKHYLDKVILSCNPCLYPDDWVAVAIVSVGSDPVQLFFIRSGEDSWIQPRLDKFFRMDDACFYQGKLYMVNHRYDYLVAIDFSQHKDEEGWTRGINNYDDTSVTKIKIKYPQCCVFWSCLIELERDLLLVYRIYYIAAKEEISEGFKVWKLSDSGNNTAEWIEIQDLGNFSLFLGNYNESVAIHGSSNVTNFQRNCIYYTGPYGEEDLCIYNLATQQFSRYNILEPSHKYLAPCAWISPTLGRTLLAQD